VVFEKSRRTVLVFTILALGAITLDVPAALAASPLNGPGSHAYVHRMNSVSVPHTYTFRAQPQRQVDDPLLSLWLG